MDIKSIIRRDLQDWTSHPGTFTKTAARELLAKALAEIERLEVESTRFAREINRRKHCALCESRDCDCVCHEKY